MKAVLVQQFAPFRDAVVGESPEPAAGPGQVVVDLRACDVNFPDILLMEGKYQRLPPLPFTPGMGGAGRISACGSGVSGFAVGQKVLVLPDFGAFAEKVGVAAHACYPVPEDVPFSTAAALGLVYQTAYFALTERAGLRRGETVVVLGATGGVGMAAMQLAKALGAQRVIGVVRGEERIALAGELGADAVLDVAGRNLRDHVKAEILALTEGRGADVVIDPVGGELNAAVLRAMAWSGRLVTVGFASGEVPKIGANYLLVHNIAASGLQWTDYRDREPGRVAAAQAQIFRWWREGRLRPRISTLPLECFAEALASFGNGLGGKVTLTVGGEVEE